MKSKTGIHEGAMTPERRKEIEKFVDEYPYQLADRNYLKECLEEIDRLERHNEHLACGILRCDEKLSQARELLRDIAEGNITGDYVKEKAFAFLDGGKK